MNLLHYLFFSMFFQSVLSCPNPTLLINSDMFCQFSMIFFNWGLGSAPQSLRGCPLHILCPKIAFFIRLGFHRWPSESSSTWALFGVTFRGFACTVATHVLSTCFCGWASDAKWLESEICAPCFVCYNHCENECFRRKSLFL